MDNTTEAATQMRQISPKELAAYVTIFRKTQGWTQETLAEISRLTVRTVQRVENAEPSSLDTRRALARAFRIADIDIFNKTYDFKSPEQIRVEAEEFRKTHLLLDVSIAINGKHLADLAEQLTMYVFQQPDEVSPEVANSAAALFDDMKDYGDIINELSFTDKLSTHNSLSKYVATLKEAGFSVCYASRATAIVGKAWTDKTPMPVTIGYVFVARSGQEPKQIAVPKALGEIKLGF